MVFEEWHGCVAGYFWILSTQEVDADYYLQVQAKLRMKTVVHMFTVDLQR